MVKCPQSSLLVVIVRLVIKLMLLLLLLFRYLVCVEVLVDVHDLVFVHWDLVHEWVLLRHLHLWGWHGLDLSLGEEWWCRQFIAYHIFFIDWWHVIWGIMTKIAFIACFSEWKIHVLASLARPITITLIWFLLFFLVRWCHNLGCAQAGADVSFWAASCVPVKVSIITVIEIGFYL